MSEQIFNRSIAIARENGIPVLNFFGGEPLLNPQFFQMLQTAFESGFSTMLATNCRLLANKDTYDRFLTITRNYRRKIQIFTARDNFHLHFFDPNEVIGSLRAEGYEVFVSDYSDKTVLISEHNVRHDELRKLNTQYSCCGGRWTDYLGVLPDGGWTLCPPSLESFGNIFADDLTDIVDFKRGLPLRFGQGCTDCLKDFKRFRNEFDTRKPVNNLNSVPEINNTLLLHVVEMLRSAEVEQLNSKEN